MKPWGPLTIAAACGLFVATPALADVKAGVDAWTAGDFAKAVAEWQGPAAKGDPDALFNMAQAYRLGRGVPVDMAKAEEYYARAAAKGHLKAADNYGLLLFQDGRRKEAMPYIEAAAGRGDPRAQYLLGIARFNGDLLPKDWVKAYALLTLANAAGLPQAKPAIQQMDDYIPLAQRQQAQSLAAQMRSDADTTRASQMAAADLDADSPQVTQVASAKPASVLPRARMPQPVQSVAVPPSGPAIADARAAVAEAMRATGTESPAQAGADFATRPVNRPVVQAAPAPVPERPARAAPSAPPTASAGWPWKVQLGAFSVAGNADKLWSQLSGKSVLAGKTKLTVPAGRLTKLLAGGWTSRDAAQSACDALKAGGQPCLVTR
ncbi:SPOR domain-containing protein [Tsuneonella mangrovi]|uniref:SPOR domain-containing protein n=1 Tax=Tsuneonella mangrovi TaxID=1982042 RepID=UPI000BA1E36F|nr:SPOR domain-containing protein [Tsuneonella mangrovi]